MSLYSVMEGTSVFCTTTRVWEVLSSETFLLREK